MTHDLRLAVHHDPGHPSKPWVVGVEVAPDKLQVLDRYGTKSAAVIVLKKLLPTSCKHIAS